MIAVLEFVVTLVVVFAGGMWLFGTDAGRSIVEQFSSGRQQREKAKTAQTISHRGSHSEGGVLTCPRCGGTQFKVARKTSTKLTFGAASLLGQAHWVRCVTCGTRYRRG